MSRKRGVTDPPGLSRVKVVPCPMCAGDVFRCDCLAVHTAGPWRMSSGILGNDTLVVADAYHGGAKILATVTRAGLIYSRVDVGAANAALVVESPALLGAAAAVLDGEAGAMGLLRESVARASRSGSRINNKGS